MRGVLIFAAYLVVIFLASWRLSPISAAAVILSTCAAIITALFLKTYFEGRGRAG